MVRRPDTTHTLVETRHGLLLYLQLLATGILKNHGLCQDIVRLEVAHAD